eukprot:15469103-Alexandrium_andersonii.AAC.1
MPCICAETRSLNSNCLSGCPGGDTCSETSNESWIPRRIAGRPRGRGVSRGHLLCTLPRGAAQL